MGRLRAAVQDDRVVAASLVLLGVVLAMLGLAGRPAAALDGTVVEQYSVWWHLLILVCAAATLLAKRRHPVLTLAVVAALAALDGYLGGGIAIFVVALRRALHRGAGHPAGRAAPDHRRRGRRERRRSGRWPC